MHPVHNKERRLARVKALRKTYERDDDRVRYTDAARYKGRKAHAISVVNNKGDEGTAASVRTLDTDSAEEAAIALAATTGMRTNHGHNRLASRLPELPTRPNIIIGPRTVITHQRFP
ncbi:unnamed protein product [Ixodes hexagonus]